MASAFQNSTPLSAAIAQNTPTRSDLPLSFDLSIPSDAVISVASNAGSESVRHRHNSLTTTALETGLMGLDIKQLAAEGYLQAIAYWLNEPLIPQQVYAQVLADALPGRLKVLIEYQREPEPKRLIRFICHRLCQLNSTIIEGVYLLVRPVGSATTAWEKRCRITSRAAAKKQPVIASQSNNEAKSASRANSPSSLTSTSSSSSATPGASVAGVEPISATRPRLLHESSRSQVARRIVRGQFKFFRAATISGSAVAAFLFGGFSELILSARMSAPAQSAHAVQPWHLEPLAQADTAFTGNGANAPSDAIGVSFRPASRFPGKTVEAALETVAVVPHRDVVNPSEPTVTLLFGGELGLNDFIFEGPESLDQLFSALDIYRKADIAMVGLSEPLALASTSLQENFYQRTRPQAVQSLKAAGIDIVGLANEGTLTYGSRGLGETLETLDRQGIYRVGAGLNQREAHRPEILEVKGQRIAYLGYNSEAIKAAKAEKAGVAQPRSEERQHILEDIKAIRPQVDWVVVNYRWGNTLETSENTVQDTGASESLEQALVSSAPADWQKALAHAAVDAGADLVVGYHPNQIQGAEIYRDRAIAYSLGDFVFGKAPLEDHDTAALRVSLRNQRMKIEFLPVSIRNSKLTMATGDRATDILQRIRSASKGLNKPMHFPTVLEAQPLRHLPAKSRSLTFEPSKQHGTLPPTQPLESTEETLPTEEPWTEPTPNVQSPASPPTVDGSTGTDAWPPDRINKPPKPYEVEAPPYEEPIETFPYEEPVDIEEGYPQTSAPATNSLMKESEALFGPSYRPTESPLNVESLNREDEQSHLAAPKPGADFLQPTDSSQPIGSDYTPQLDKPAPGAIAPYEEPLVGPLSALPEQNEAAEQTLQPQQGTSSVVPPAQFVSKTLTSRSAETTLLTDASPKASHLEPFIETTVAAH